MIDIAEQIRIDREPQVVWMALADFGSIAAWAPNVDHSCMTTAQASGVGATRRVQVGRNVLLERVVEWEPGASIAYELEGLPPVVRSAVNRWTLAESNGATDVTLTTHLEPAGPRPPQKVAARVFGRVLAKASRGLLAGLDAHVGQVAA